MMRSHFLAIVQIDESPTSTSTTRTQSVKPLNKSFALAVCFVCVLFRCCLVKFNATHSFAYYRFYDCLFNAVKIMNVVFEWTSPSTCHGTYQTNDKQRTNGIEDVDIWRLLRFKNSIVRWVSFSFWSSDFIPIHHKSGKFRYMALLVVLFHSRTNSIVSSVVWMWLLMQNNHISAGINRSRINKMAAFSDYLLSVGCFHSISARYRQ